MFENQGLITEVRKISALINDLENDIAYWEEPKENEALTGVIFVICFMLKITGTSWGQAAKPQKHFAM